MRDKREELGVTLYNLQQELARHQMMLNKEHDHLGEVNQNRQRIDQELKETKEKHDNKKVDLDTQMKQSTFLREISSRGIAWLGFFQPWARRRNVTFYDVNCIT